MPEHPARYSKASCRRYKINWRGGDFIGVKLTASPVLTPSVRYAISKSRTDSGLAGNWITGPCRPCVRCPGSAMVLGSAERPSIVVLVPVLSSKRMNGKRGSSNNGSQQGYETIARSGQLLPSGAAYLARYHRDHYLDSSLVMAHPCLFHSRRNGSYNRAFMRGPVSVASTPWPLR